MFDRVDTRISGLDKAKGVNVCMDLRNFTLSGEDYSLYAPPGNYELRGKQFTVTFNGGKRLTLSFPSERSPRCVKITDSVWLIATLPPEPLAACVLDLEAGLVTRAIPLHDGGFELSFGALEGISGPLHKLTNELTGNTVEWIFGAADSSVIRIGFEDNTVALTRPFARGEPKLLASGFNAVKITETVYLQTAIVTCDKKVMSVCLLSDFHRVLSVGCVFGPGEAARIIGGHGRFPKDAYSNYLPPLKDSSDSEAVFAVDLRTLCPFGKGAIRQYTPPRCFDLVGKVLGFIMDDGFDFTLRFIDNDRLEWRRAEDTPAEAEYMCLKADDTTYLVIYELSDVQKRINHTFVIDLENMLVTRIIASIGLNPRWPYLIKTEFEFGMIESDEDFTPYPRHGFTSDMVGNVVQWAYGSEMSTVHVYHCSDFYRITHPKDRGMTREEASKNYVFAEMQGLLPSTDEPTKYVKIKEGMYLISLTEINCEKLLGAKLGFRSNTLCFLQNYKRNYVVGRAFGTTTQSDGIDTETNITIGAYGRIVDDIDDHIKSMLTDPNPFLV